MGKITKLARKGPRSPCYLVAVDGGDEVELLADTVIQFRLGPGDEVARGRWDEIRSADAAARCWNSAVRLISHRQRSRSELRRALAQRRFDPGHVDAAMERAEQAGLLDDARFAQVWVEGRTAGGRTGPRLVAQELKARGVDPEIVAHAVKPLESRDGQRESALRLLRKWERTHRKGDLDKRRSSAAGYLMRRGFESEIVWDLVREVLGEDYE